MRISVISFTGTGKALGLRLCEHLRADGDICLETDIHMPGISLKTWTQQQFSESDALVFIGAAGIAVRAVAPYLRDKFTDPAVLVMDERGQYVISLLSGHVGGANDLAGRVAGMVGAQPVITTASDVCGMTAIDVWAQNHGLRIGSRVPAKQVAAAVLAGEPVGFFDEEQMGLPVPDGCVEGKRCRLNVRITTRPNDSGPDDCETDGGGTAHDLFLIPQILILGIGCRRGIAAEQIRERVFGVLDEYGFCPEAVKAVASIDIKKDEKGLAGFCESLGIPLWTYPAVELEQVPGTFEESEFVRQVTGTGNVCERAALLAAGEGAFLVAPKQAGCGVTVAAAKMRADQAKMKMDRG